MSGGGGAASKEVSTLPAVKHKSLGGPHLFQGQVLQLQPRVDAVSSERRDVIASVHVYQRTVIINYGQCANVDCSNRVNVGIRCSTSRRVRSQCKRDASRSGTCVQTNNRSRAPQSIPLLSELDHLKAKHTHETSRGTQRTVLATSSERSDGPLRDTPALKASGGGESNKTRAHIPGISSLRIPDQQRQDLCFGGLTKCSYARVCQHQPPSSGSHDLKSNPEPPTLVQSRILSKGCGSKHFTLHHTAETCWHSLTTSLCYLYSSC